MLDSNHNAHDKYYLVKGSFAGSWNHIPKDVVIAVYCFFSSRRRHTMFDCDWSSDVCSSDLGFAGSTADAFSLFSRFEAKLEQYHGNIGRGAVELAKDWRTDKFLRHLEALLLVSDKEQTFLLSGQGDVIEPDGGIAAIGSGGPYAPAAAQALAGNTPTSGRQIAEEAMKIAGKMCIYTNEKVTIEEL